MKADFIDFIVEEPSMEAFLRDLLPRLAPGLEFAIYPFQSKQDLLARLPARLSGYASWLPQNHYIVVIVDRDDDDCHQLKHRLEAFASDARLITRSQPDTDRFVVINRIAVEELEAWYFGDWEAVCAAYPRVPATIPQQRGYRDPDAIAGGTWEAFERVLKQAGYFKTGLRKLEAARAIAPHISPTRNTSRSFQVLLKAVMELAGA